MQGQLYSGVDGTDALCQAGKGSGQDENPHHKQNVGIGSSLRKHIYALGKVASRHYHCPNGSNDESHRNRHLVEVVRYNRHTKICQ